MAASRLSGSIRNGKSRAHVRIAGKRVAVIGNVATAVQVVPVVAREAADVWEFKRNPY